MGTRRFGTMVVTVAAMVLIHGASAPDRVHAQAPQASFTQRPTDVTAVMSTSRGTYDGTYTLSNLARACGEVTKEQNFAGVDAFIVEFPYEAGDFQVTNVSFDSTELVRGVTTTTKFHLTVGVKSPRIGQPSAGTVTLKVDGVNDRGQTVDLTVICKPKPR